jgi:RNA polymerase sigma-70 factor (ECF subfamily)
MTDIELITLRHQGDEDAFTALFRKYNGYVYTVAINLLHDHYLAQDAVQEVFIKLWEKRQDVRGDVSPQNYIFTLTWRHSRDMLQKRKFHQQHSQTEELAESSDHLERKERRERLEKMLNRIREPFQQIVRIRYLDGMSWKEMSSIVGCRKQTIANRLHKGIVLLRKQIKPAL